MVEYRGKRIDVAYSVGAAIQPFEYLCRDCKQLRLSFVALDKCGNCGSTNIIKGDIGTLKKEQ